MRQWEYLRLDLNGAPRCNDETVVLNGAGEQGWELVSISGNGLAIFKREIGQQEKSGSLGVSRSARKTPESGHSTK